ncbi:unnamed protein product, partial [Rotaria sp. Silwood2]
DIVLRILANTGQLRGQIDMTLVCIPFDYLYLLMRIL